MRKCVKRLFFKYYGKLSHFSDMLKISNEPNEPNKINSYTDKQFEEDLQKWLSESKTIQSDKIDKKV